MALVVRETQTRCLIPPIPAASALVQPNQQLQPTDELPSRSTGCQCRWDPLQRVSVLQCHGCSRGVVVLEDTYWGGTRHEGSGKSVSGFHWWPIPGGTPLSTDVPSSVSDAFSEGSRCLSAQRPMVP